MLCEMPRLAAIVLIFIASLARQENMETLNLHKTADASLRSPWSESAGGPGVHHEEWAGPATPRPGSEWDEEVTPCECDLQLTQVNTKLRSLVQQLNSTLTHLDTKYFILKDTYLNLQDANKLLKNNISKLLEHNSQLTSENLRLNQTLLNVTRAAERVSEQNTKLRRELVVVSGKVATLNKTVELVSEENAQLWNFTTTVSKEISTSSEKKKYHVNHSSSDLISDIQWNLAELNALQEQLTNFKDKCEERQIQEVGGSADDDGSSSDLASLKKKLQFLIELQRKKCSQTIRNLDMVKLENRYYFVSGQGFALRWYDARDFCLEHHLTLAHIETADENSRIIAHIKENTNGVYLWTGGTQDGHVGRFVWTASSGQGPSLEFSDWEEGRPARGRTARNCVALWTVSDEQVKWRDQPCSSKLRFVCEMQETCDYQAAVDASSSTTDASSTSAIVP